MSDVFTLQVPVPPSGARGYGVQVGEGVLEAVAPSVRAAASAATRVGVLSDENVFALHGAPLLARLRAAGLEPVVHVIAPGEASKHIESVLACVDAWAAAGLSRRDAVVALGGGVVTDLAGLVAHLYMRGVPWIAAPSSLLAQVDASVGGKVAVDRPGAKNLLGAFHFPAAVLVDPQLLTTLPRRELACGAAEMIKHALLFAPEELPLLEAAAPALLAGDAVAAMPRVATSIALKAACVAGDPFENAPAGRVLLNLGHTVGHAIEHASGWAVGHGEAVALGLVAAARVSHHRGLATAELQSRVVEALAAFELPHVLAPWLTPTARPLLAAAIALDKKRGTQAVGTVTYIALRDIGAPEVVAMSIDELMAAL
ncbi:MAG: 3-dehydroquinate synthase [Nannocystaceae bacterium]|nr:3-dehydroquinate synthase [Deltaproteobacteria bacterium]MBP7285829.1 3-dehydroquinate synthase [Nannocystaceae bacterium]